MKRQNRLKLIIMESPKDQLIELYYQRVIAMTNKIEQLQIQINNYERKN